MGMYDYIGHDGDQVKCFYVPCISINKDVNPPKVSFYTSGGTLNSVNNAPYMTPYYNYGKDFAIVDDSFANDTSDVLVHIVQDGLWKETCTLSETPENYPWPPVTINKYGRRYNVKSQQELMNMFIERCNVQAKYEQLATDRLNQAGLERQPDFQKLKAMPADQINQEVKAREDIEHSVFEETYNPFNSKYINDEHETPLEIIGLVVAQREFELSITDTRKRIHTDEEWRLIVTSAINQLKPKFENPVESYFEWCDKEGIIIDKEFVNELFQKYSSN